MQNEIFFHSLELDRGNFKPLYLQLYQQIAEDIQNGLLTSGDRIPPELEIASTLNISRMTVRQAMDELIEKGYVYREQGRGTFISVPRMQGVRGFTSFTEDMRSRGLTFDTKVLEVELTDADEIMRETLKLEEDSKVIKLSRIRIVEGIAWAYQVSSIPASIAPGLENEDLSQSLFHILKDKYHVYPAWTEAKVTARCARKAECEALGIKRNEVVLVVDGLTFTDSFDVVESVRTIYRADEVSLYMGRQRHAM